MATVYPDLAQSCGGVHHIQSGWAITRVFIVDGLTTGGTWTSGAFLDAAVTAVEGVTGLRGIGTCPGISVPNYLEQFIPEVISDRSCRVRVIYKGFPAAVYEFRGVQNSVESNLDANGDLITVQYTFPSDYTLNPALQDQTIIQGGMITKEVPEAVAVARWIQGAGTIGGTSHTGLEMISYFWHTWQGTLNDANYTIGLLTGAAGSWKISDVRGVSRDGGFTFEASMEFQYRSAGWDQLVVFIDPETGRPPSNLIAGVGYYRPPAFPRVTFPTIIFGGN